MSAGRRQKAPLAQSLLGALLHDWQLQATSMLSLSLCLYLCLLLVSLYFYCSNQIDRIVSGFVSCPRKRIHLRNTSWSICIHICQRLYWVLCSVCVFHFHNFACLPQDVAHCTVVRQHTVRTQFCLTYDRIKAQRLPLMQMPWRIYPPAPVCSAYRLPWSARFAFELWNFCAVCSLQSQWTDDNFSLPGRRDKCNLNCMKTLRGNEGKDSFDSPACLPAKRRKLPAAAWQRLLIGKAEAEGAYNI